MATTVEIMATNLVGDDRGGHKGAMPILAALSFVLVGFLAYVASRPAQFKIHRKRSMKADASAVFALINDFRHWERWSPWDKIDPDMTREYTGAQSGVGAKYHWVGNKNVGEGQMEILDVTDGQRVVIDLNFIKPFAAHNKTTFTVERDGDGAVSVTWLMEGNNNFMAKAFNVFMNMDKMVGADFEKGLAAIESSLANAAAKQEPASAAA